jgi:tRNA(Ile)-lysidine synthase
MIVDILIISIVFNIDIIDMIKITGNIPPSCTIACSGGVDSIAIADFLSKSRNIKLAFFHHGTSNSDNGLEVVTEFASSRNLDLTVGRLSRSKSAKESWEEYWRIERYSFLDSLNETIVTGHNLDDLVETWLFYSVHGLPRVIPYRRGLVIRPFLTTRKSEFIDWCTKRNINWFEDLSNKDISYSRNRIRHNILPEALKVNPGLYTVVKKYYEDKGTYKL